MLSFRVSSASEPGSVAGALAGGIRSCGEAVLVTIGAGALNQAVKAVVIASDFLREYETEIAMEPSFSVVDIDGVEKTAIRLRVYAKKRSGIVLRRAG
ncbi:MAG: stage V sporulation protein S [Clostridia bacterium]|jgi:stage V sporulation protein S|nr:stage V sporulation protein S [Clostridia bacterium]MBO7397892.1 stage V sporulation protein S [Clostridia bacterium]MBO7504571.1 stage V sporulation protein S [Clostridia bacterium]MBO7658620.1 stage V sporulation protein S [Clostridia bacterium]MBP5665986.1 stage V sporulation protein S [Clostridia bacterium]